MENRNCEWHILLETTRQITKIVKEQDTDFNVKNPLREKSRAHNQR